MLCSELCNKPTTNWSNGDCSLAVDLSGLLELIDGDYDVWPDERVRKLQPKADSSLPENVQTVKSALLHHTGTVIFPGISSSFNLYRAMTVAIWDRNRPNVRESSHHYSDIQRRRRLKKLTGQEVAIFRQTCANFRQRRLWVFNVSILSHKFVRNWGF